MNLYPNTQNNLYGFDDIFLNLKNLYDQNKLPNTILFSGQKGIGKCTMAYHLSNYILSLNEINHYSFHKKTMNVNNKSFKLNPTLVEKINSSTFCALLSSDKLSIYA